MADIELGVVGLVPRGEWDATRYYSYLHLVTYNGQAYLGLRDTTGDTPDTSRDDWMLITKRGESLYQMMVREGRFSGTEEEFLDQYQAALSACHDAVRRVDGKMKDVDDTMSGYGRTMKSYSNLVDGWKTEEKKREEAENERNTAETKRGEAEAEREKKDSLLDEHERRREESMRQIKQDSKQALSMASTAQEKAEKAYTTITEDEAERKREEEKRKAAETERQKNEEIREGIIGDLSTLQTEDKSSIVGSINEIVWEPIGEGGIRQMFGKTDFNRSFNKSFGS